MKHEIKYSFLEISMCKYLEFCTFAMSCAMMLHGDEVGASYLALGAGAYESLACYMENNKEESYTLEKRKEYVGK